MPEKLEVQIREGSSSSTILARDQITISGLKAGIDAITTILSNEAHTLPTTSAGVVTYTDSGTDIEVWNGTTQVPYDGSSPYASPSFRVSASGSSITVGSASTVSTYTRRFADHNSMTQNNAVITYTIIVKNEAGVENTFTRKQTFAKSIQGTDGAAGADGADGTDGAAGLRTIQGYLYYEKTTSGAPSAPSGTTYTFSTGVVSGTGINDGGSTNVWRNSPTTQDAASSNFWWTVRYYGTESSAGSSTITVAYSNVVQLTNFSGVVTFSNGTFNDGSDITTIDGGNIAASSTITVGSDGQVLVDGANNRIIVSD